MIFHYYLRGTIGMSLVYVLHGPNIMIHLVLKIRGPLSRGLGVFDAVDAAEGHLLEGRHLTRLSPLSASGLVIFRVCRT